MIRRRHVVLGLAPARAPWFRAVTQWATSGAMAMEFIKCVSAEEARARLSSARPFSALLVDAGLPTLDRDLLDTAWRAGCPVIVVEDPRVGRDWASLGVAGLLPVGFGPAQLAESLGAHAAPVASGDELLVSQPAAAPGTRWRGRVVSVVGSGGVGTSTVAIALAQGLAADVRHGGSVLLADLALRADQAMLHDAGDVLPGVQELCEAYRSATPPSEELRSMTFAVEERGYGLLLGLRRPRAWATLRPRSFEAAFEGLRQSWRVVVCDTDADLEGEAEGGSADVEERHLMARTATAAADVVLAVGLPGLKGLHSLVRVLGELRGHGTATERIVPVLNRSARGARARAQLAEALAGLAGPAGDLPLASPVFLPERRVEAALHDGVRLPPGLAEPLVGAVAAVLDRVPAPPAGSGEPVRVTPGTVGAWSSDDGGRDEEAATG